jgi:hypothetical protein
VENVIPDVMQARGWVTWQPPRIVVLQDVLANRARSVAAMFLDASASFVYQPRAHPRAEFYYPQLHALRTDLAILGVEFSA